MTATAVPKRLNCFERYLTLWVAACMVVGVLLGKLAPDLIGALRALEIGEGGQINVVLLGGTGSIAAYQAADLIGLLRSQLASVRVVMTRSATRFITPLTLEVISEHPVTVDMFEGSGHAYVEHITLASSADLLLIAPATANIIGKLANGIADDMLSTTALAVTGPLLIAPAMNERMWVNPAVQANVEHLRTRGACFVDPDHGPMVCGGEGWGRLARLEEIVRRASDVVRRAVSGVSVGRPRDVVVHEREADGHGGMAGSGAR
jgi:phosphopantothenoylcysteine decarboxylase/phosphopantothenate--cysteine ligase